MGKVGDVLRKTREAKGLSLQQVEDETNMRWKYIEALEEENYEVIPGQAYVKGFLRNYSAFLGLNPEEILELYKEYYEKPVIVERPEEVRSAKRIDRKKTKQKQTRFILIIVALAVLLGSGWMVWAGILGPNTQTPNTNPQAQKNQPKGQNQQTPPPQTKPDSAGKLTTPTPGGQSATPIPGGHSATTPGGQVTPQGVNLTLKSSGGNCWIGVVIDGQKAYAGFLKNGETKNFKANNKIGVRYGNAGVVDVFYQGNSLGKPGSIGQVVNKEYTK